MKTKKHNFKTMVLALWIISISGFSQESKEQPKNKIQKKVINARGTPSMIVFKKSSGYTLNKRKQILKEQLNLKHNDEFRILKSQSDHIGFTHEKHQQYYKGVKVEFGTYTLHAKGLTVKSINGDFHPINNLDTSPAISNKLAFEKALQHTNAKEYLWEYPLAAKEMDGYKKPEGELVILPGSIIDKKSPRLAYKFDIYAASPVSRGDLYIDAHTGEVLFYNATIKHTSVLGATPHHHHEKMLPDNSNDTYLEEMAPILVSGTAQTRYSGTRSIETRLDGANYTLNDASRKVYTRDAKNQPVFGFFYINNYSEFTDDDNNWTTIEHSSNKDDAALDAHWGAMMTYDYFLNAHSRDSYNGNGAQIRSYVHVATNYDNAFWNGSVMSYGDGSSNGDEGNGNFDALTSIDVAAHEIGHAVTEFTSDLVYRNESGALNESYSDIWAATVEHFAKGNGNDANPDPSAWLIGDEIDRRPGSIALRSMIDPKQTGGPDTYKGTNWVFGSQDNGGVHTNSSVMNHWFYLLTVGGSGTNDNNDSYNVIGINIEKAANIAYRATSVYLSSNSGYDDARTYTIQSAEDLYGANSQEVISVTNAWYAVGVGDEAVQQCALAAPANLTASGINDGGFTLSWDPVPSAASYDVTINGTSYNTTNTTYTVTGLSPGTSYTNTVSARCDTGGSGAQSSINVTTTGTPAILCNGTISSYPYSEGFESNDGWTQISGDDGNWIRDSRGTPSFGTGPRSAIEGSYYMYLEASFFGSGQIGSNATAILESDCYDLSSTSSATFSFQHHMYGSSVGSLIIQATADDMTWTDLWNLSGNQGNRWNAVDIDLSAYAGGTVKLRIVGTTGNGWSSDIAVDGINLTTEAQTYEANTSFANNSTLPASGENANLTDFRLFPNPVTDYLNITTPQDMLSIGVYSTTGLQVSNITIQKSGIDVSRLKPGIYLVVVNTEKGEIKQRFIKQ